MAKLKKNMGKYYNPTFIFLSGREYEVLKNYKNGNKLICFPTFGGREVIARPADLDGTYKEICENKIQEEKERIWRSHGRYNDEPIYAVGKERLETQYTTIHNRLLSELFGKHFRKDREESELREIEVALGQIYGCFIRAAYDCVWSHKFHDSSEHESRKACNMLDWVINYELYETEEARSKNEGGYDGDVHELQYLKGNGNYIVITGTE